MWLLDDSYCVQDALPFTRSLLSCSSFKRTPFRCYATPTSSTMKFICTITIFLVVASAKILGFNLGQGKPDGSCKTLEDYVTDFNAIDEQYRVIKSFGIFDPCQGNSLSLLLDAAKKTKGKVLVGVWGDTSIFDKEKTALMDILGQPGVEDHIVGVVVCSECLYRTQFKGDNEITPAVLAARISEVKNMVKNFQSKGISNIPVGCADTWNVLVDPQNVAVLKVVDTIFVNCFPYWEGLGIGSAPATFFDAIEQVKNSLHAVNPSASIAVGETGWPTEGKPFGSSVPSLENSRAFWVNVFCKLRGMGMDAYWFEAFDEPMKVNTQNMGVESHWGTYDTDGKKKFELTC
ncbi:Glucan 1,3-beta-glucosidase BGL2 [Neolecta irregularis DAH-3]|uniref:glucan 1,3-beta-glucosidase n=1 Tax=Neolecta irregularis (strain DAH-3) TaxID=1198029 RepID=A0A1U7LJY9_NEOID|nr:Glucan 1,3-beta-glucosidase BGL2 [Neolecta irregularis DAH-3]|eukprot:OLL22948.1 Glucan 1,3-beta-glucosidase BGL2 [Neolecta irregularis DAH-3]